METTEETKKVDVCEDAKFIRINGNNVNVLEVEFDQINSIVEAKLIFAQISYFRDVLQHQLDTKEFSPPKDGETQEQHREWANKVKWLLIKLNRQLKICNAKEVDLARREKAKKQNTADRQILDELRRSCPDEFKEALNRVSPNEPGNKEVAA